MSRLTTFAEQIGFIVTVGSDVVRAVEVPCLLADGVIGSCTIETSFDPKTGKPNASIGDAVHVARITTDRECDGRVYHANGAPIEKYIGGDDKTWSHISIKKGGQDNPEDDESPQDLVHRYARQIVGAVSAAGYTEPASLAVPGPFRIPNTFEARSGIGPVQDRIRNQHIAIIGLGGTGSYVLDLMAKTPVVAIHVLDDDEVCWHNFMRAPGAPTVDEIALRRSNSLRKVDYYHAKYDSLREGIHPHHVRVDDVSMLGEFISTHRIDYAFVCIDQLPDSDSPRQDIVYSALSQAEVPFIDSGISISLNNDVVSGAVTTSAYTAGSREWTNFIPNARAGGNLPGYRNVQLPEVNALAASLAVMEWRRRTGQYDSNSTLSVYKFRLETPEKPRVVKTE